MNWAEFVTNLVNERFHGNQSALARAIGVRPQTVQRWVDGGGVEPVHLRQFAAGVGLPLMQLMAIAWGIPADEISAGASGYVLEHDHASLTDPERSHIKGQFRLLRRSSIVSQIMAGAVEDAVKDSEREGIHLGPGDVVQARLLESGVRVTIDYNPPGSAVPGEEGWVDDEEDDDEDDEDEDDEDE